MLHVVVVSPCQHLPHHWNIHLPNSVSFNTLTILFRLLHTWAKCPIFLHLLHDSFLAGHFSCGLCALYPHLSHFWASSLLPFGFLKFLAFLCCLEESFFHATLLTSILGSSPDITYSPSLVALNIRLMLMVVLRVRFLLFSRQRCCTRSSSDLHAMVFRINLFVSVMSSPLARSLRSVTKESNVSPCSWCIQSNLTAAIIEFFLASRCPLNFSVTRSSMSLSLMSCLFFPDPT